MMVSDIFIQLIASELRTEVHIMGAATDGPAWRSRPWKPGDYIDIQGSLGGFQGTGIMGKAKGETIQGATEGAAVAYILNAIDRLESFKVKCDNQLALYRTMLPSK